MIVKVQVSIFTSDGIKTALIYDEARDICQEVAVSKYIDKLMDGAEKKFFHVEVNNGELEFIKEAEWQDW